MGIWTFMQLMIPWAHPSPQPKRHLDQFSRFCTDDRRVFFYFTMGRPSPKCPSYGDLDQPEFSTQTASRSVQPFCRAD